MSGRRRATLAIGAVSSLVAISIAAYALGHGRLGASNQAGVGPAGHPAASPSADIHHGDLRRYLLAAPTGSQAWPKPLGTDRTLSLTQVAHLSTDYKDRRLVLTNDHFTHGAVQCWIAKSGTWVDVRLYQFRSPGDAQNFFHSDIASTAHGIPGSSQSSVSNVPGAKVIASRKPDDQGYISILAVGVRGDVTFVVDLAEQSKTAQLALPDSLTRAQFSKL